MTNNNEEDFEDYSYESYPEELGNLSEEQQIAYAQKMFEAYATFSSHFSNYIKQNDKDLWQRAVDYAMTFTQEDVSGIKMYYQDEEENKNEEN
jgi:hypothetical protein